MLEVIQPSWSSFSLQLTDHITIDLGNLPHWITALAAAGSFLKSRKAEKAANVAVTKIEEVRHETNSMREAIEAEKLVEGRKQVHDEIAAAKEVVRTDAVADAQAAADVRAAEMPTNQTKTPA